MPKLGNKFLGKCLRKWSAFINGYKIIAWCFFRRNDFIRGYFSGCEILAEICIRRGTFRSVIISMGVINVCGNDEEKAEQENISLFLLWILSRNSSWVDETWSWDVMPLLVQRLRRGI